jgi:hypothetical protein
MVGFTLVRSQYSSLPQPTHAAIAANTNANANTDPNTAANGRQAD